MCARTKYTFGCGHTLKITNECHSSRCEGIHRVHFARDGDCSECKRGGAAVTRGRDGQGRYAREHKLNRSSKEKKPEREPLVDVSSNTNPPSPWKAPPSETEEKLWSTEPRQKADDAWLREHADRQSVSAPATPEADGHEDRENQQYSPHSQKRGETTERKLHREIRKIQELEDSHHRSHRRERQNSYDSFPSVESHRTHRSQSYQYSASPPTPRYEYRDPYIQPNGYGCSVYGSSPSHTHTYDTKFMSGSPYQYGYSIGYPPSPQPVYEVRDPSPKRGRGRTRYRHG